MNTVMIIAGESSGELYGSLLARTLRHKWADLHIMGVGGERMKEAGVELVSPISDAFGLVEAVSSLNKIKTAFNNSIDAIKKFRPGVLVLIDYPDFNLKVAKAAKKFGIKILYYVSPQVWAWRKSRVKKIAGLTDRMAVILPFEEKIYGNAGLTCEFVGHPILEEIEAVLEAEFGSIPTISPPSASPLPFIPPVGGGGVLSPTPELRALFKSDLGLDPDKPLLRSPEAGRGIEQASASYDGCSQTIQKRSGNKFTKELPVLYATCSEYGRKKILFLFRITKTGRGCYEERRNREGTRCIRHGGGCLRYGNPSDRVPRSPDGCGV
jgi:hypothetical protein